MLGLDARFDLDEDAITRAWLGRAAAVHPDLASKDADPDELARRSAMLNDAKHTLADPENRANALLATFGGPTASECKDLPDGFLMEIFDVRQAMDEAVLSGNASDKEAFDQLARDRRTAHIERVGQLFRSHADSQAEAAIREIRVELNAWRYIERMIEQLD